MQATIIIPSYNRPRQLATCLAALAKLDGGPWPIVVVDDGSKVALGEVCTPYSNVRLVRQDNAGPGAARNRGVEEAEDAHLLLFIDDDCMPEPQWANCLVEAQSDVPGRLVGGRIVNALPRNVYSSASQSLSTYLYEFYQASGSDMIFFTTNNMCCRREDFLKSGGFGSRFPIASEDRDFGIRWSASGGELVYAPDAVVAHAHDLGLASFWRQHRNYGRGARHLHLAMDQREDPRPKLESARFYFGMLSHPLRNPGHNRLAQSALIALSQVAMVAGYIAEIGKGGATPSS
ncbi:glycosyltransferase family 2 protein [Erythrobacter sp.]|jgi:GT2 family glycosyltransferase|uniref:glycosyltransferase family 2 protein n=1 Tax=Erythrobacter sp. TaxID=1042 RepID=UPI002EACB24E|nr:glycosyltransferase family A protein [Erythrobacter sp.]